VGYGLGMSTTMTMNQVIHHAVRRDLERLESALAAAGDGDAARAGQLERAYANLQRELTHHHEGEDEFVFPFLATHGAAPELLKAMDDEHHAMAAALAETRAAMDAYPSSGSASDAEIARASVARTRAVVDRHLSHEENDLEPLLEPYLQTKQWKRTVEKRLRPSSLAATGSFLAWIQDGMTAEDRAYVRSRIPPPVSAVPGRAAGRGYHRDIAPTWQR
jgi:hemerythrin-like domain-containing protein